MIALPKRLIMKILTQNSKIPNAAVRIAAMGIVKTIENKMAQTTGVTIAATNPRPRAVFPSVMTMAGGNCAARARFAARHNAPDQTPVG